MTIQTTDFRKGLKVEMEGKPYLVVKSDFTNPGKGSAFYKVKLKNLENGNVIERTYKSGVSTGLLAPDLEEKDADFMYLDGDSFYFMDQTTYETLQVHEDYIDDERNYLQEGIKVKLIYYKGRPISIDLPNFVELKISETDPGLKGDTATGGLKKAKVETGAQINVPLFIKEGETIRIDTRTGEYVERVKS